MSRQTENASTIFTRQTIEVKWKDVAHFQVSCM